MIKLLIDTSQTFLMCCLQKGDDFFEKIIPHGNQLGSVLSIEVNNLFEKADIHLSDLSEIRVGIGPGSYTGTRVGVAFCEALAFGLSINLIKLPSLLFYLKKGQSALGLKSNFNTFCYIKKEQNLWHYHHKSHEDTENHLDFLDPKQIDPEPDWRSLCEVKTAAYHQDLLYFSVK